MPIPMDAALAAHLAQDETTPIRLFSIGGMPRLTLTDCEKDVFWDGKVWRSVGISYSNVEIKLGLEVDTYKLTLDNHDSAMTAWTRTADPKGETTTAWKGATNGVLDEAGRVLLAGNPVLLFEGRNTSVQIDTMAQIVVKSLLDMNDQLAAKARQQVTCRFRFKGRNCGYVGTETSCNLTQARCMELGNQSRFGGYVNLSSRFQSQ
ncbi:hypothetical protein [Niveispirillum sp. KHB5.9]|uniref:baseplate hub domain-containing protein n=1 Tax=Niveispirillum sp. KHB5.9 TaxID=3400269 RepID=UPI003A862547